MGNLGASQNGQPGATNAGQGQEATGTTTLGNSALGFVVDNTGLGTAQTALRQSQSGIQPAAFLAAGAAAAASGRAHINEDRGAKTHPNPRKPTKAHQSAVKPTKAR